MKFGTGRFVFVYCRISPTLQNTCLLTNFTVFGILNTISEFIAFFFMLFLVLLGTAITAAAGADAGVMAILITYTLTLLAHAICTIVMVSKVVCYILLVTFCTFGRT